MKRWRGLKALVHDAIDATTDLVGDGHDAAHRNVRRAAAPFDALRGPVHAIDGLVHASTRGTLWSIKAVNRVVASLSDLALDASLPDLDAHASPVPLRSDIVGTPAWIADASLGALNGAIGHHLAARANPLDLGLSLRFGDALLTPDGAADPSGPIVLLVHGLGTTEWCWALDAQACHGDPTATFGTRLNADAGLSPVYARYNTGRHIAQNGLALSNALEALYARAPFPRLVIVGHSMGGLVARAACHTASTAGQRWVDAVELVITLGTPHQGAPLARLGERVTSGLGAVDLPATQVLARLLGGRSDGVRDLAHGHVDGLDDGLDPDALAAPSERAVPLLEGVRYAFLAASLTHDPQHPAGRILGDLLVTVASASGPAHVGSPRAVPPFGGVMHHQIHTHPAVYAEVLRLVAG